MNTHKYAHSSSHWANLPLNYSARTKAKDRVTPRLDRCPALNITREKKCAQEGRLRC